MTLRLLSTRKEIKSVAAATTLTVGDSGKIIVVNCAAAAPYTVTLPDPTTCAGAEFHFINTAIGATLNTRNVTVDSSGAGLLFGHVVDAGGGAGLATITNRNVIFGAAAQVTAGSLNIKLLSNGVRYHMSGSASVIAEVTLS